MLAAIVLYYGAVFSELPEAWRRAGSPQLYLTGVLGAVLLCVSMLFAAVKRGGGGDLAPGLYVAHVIAAYAGTVLVAVHGTGHLSRPPALLYLAIVALIVSGIWARLVISRRMAATFAEKHRSFAATVTDIDRDRLRSLIAEKQALLVALDAAADEGTFSLRPEHWRGHPIAAWRYARLVAEEQALLGVRRGVPMVQGYWWFLHRAIAFVFVAGIVIHVITVTFFAGYVADGGTITWWHLMDW